MKKIRETIEYIWGVKRRRGVLGGLGFYFAHIFLWSVTWIILMLGVFGNIKNIEGMITFNLYFISILIFIAALFLLIFHGFLLFLCARKFHETKKSSFAISILFLILGGTPLNLIQVSMMVSYKKRSENL